MPCHSPDIRCGDGKCVASTARCDNVFDCKDGTDERDCDLCAPNQFKCHNGQCISQNLKCDRHPDCSDGSDELDCCKFLPHFIIYIHYKYYIIHQFNLTDCIVSSMKVVEMTCLAFYVKFFVRTQEP